MQEEAAQAPAAKRQRKGKGNEPVQKPDKFRVWDAIENFINKPCNVYFTHILYNSLTEPISGQYVAIPTDTYDDFNTSHVAYLPNRIFTNAKKAHPIPNTCGVQELIEKMKSESGQIKNEPRVDFTLYCKPTETDKERILMKLKSLGYEDAQSENPFQIPVEVLQLVYGTLLDTHFAREGDDKWPGLKSTYTSCLNTFKLFSDVSFMSSPKKADSVFALNITRKKWKDDFFKFTCVLSRRTRDDELKNLKLISPAGTDGAILTTEIVTKLLEEETLLDTIRGELLIHDEKNVMDRHQILDMKQWFIAKNIGDEYTKIISQRTLIMEGIRAQMGSNPLNRDQDMLANQPSSSTESYPPLAGEYQEFVTDLNVFEAYTKKFKEGGFYSKGVGTDTSDLTQFREFIDALTGEIVFPPNSPFTNIRNSFTGFVESAFEGDDKDNMINFTVTVIFNMIRKRRPLDKFLFGSNVRFNRSMCFTLGLAEDAIAQIEALYQSIQTTKELLSRRRLLELIIKPEEQRQIYDRVCTSFKQSSCVYPLNAMEIIVRDMLYLIDALCCNGNKSKDLTRFHNNLSRENTSFINIPEVKKTDSDVIVIDDDEDCTAQESAGGSVSSGQTSESAGGGSVSSGQALESPGEGSGSSSNASEQSDILQEQLDHLIRQTNWEPYHQGEYDRLVREMTDFIKKPTSIIFMGGNDQAKQKYRGQALSRFSTVLKEKLLENFVQFSGKPISEYCKSVISTSYRLPNSESDRTGQETMKFYIRQCIFEDCTKQSLPIPKWATPTQPSAAASATAANPAPS